jgi:hypothetical protein
MLYYTILYYTTRGGANNTPKVHIGSGKRKNPSHLVRIRQFKTTKIVALAGFEPGSMIMR